MGAIEDAIVGRYVSCLIKNIDKFVTLAALADDVQVYTYSLTLANELMISYFPAT